MSEMKSPPVGAEFEHVRTGDRVTVVEHMFDRDDKPKTPFVVEDESGEQTGYEHPAEFYDTYVWV